VDAGLELAAQLASDRADAPAALFVPFGTAGTAAGLALGLALAGLRAEVVAVRVVPRAQSPDSLPRALAVAAAAFLARHGHPEALRAVLRLRLRVENRFFGPGYGVGTAAARHAIDRLDALEGIRLEETYTGKAAAAFLDAAARDPRPRLLWVTNSAVPPPAVVVDDDVLERLPSPLRSHVR
jgi:1-aminocyclopropane-1-carboxylate deaminase/D-cysteine desulfhydrase-like pyridoxal-dependent ACC family enzyme